MTSTSIEVNIKNIVYLLFRMMPIILPTFFILSSIFSQDIKGLIYLAGLLVSTILVIMVSKSFFDLFPNWAKDTTENVKCSLISLNGISPTTIVPLSQAVYAYTFGFIIFIILAYSNKKNNLWFQNIPTILFLGGLVVADMIWNYTNECSSFAGILFSFVVAGTFGALWAWMIDKSGSVQLQYFNGLSNRTYCSRPSQQTFKCVGTKN